jgi:hypothetical protein
MEQAVRIVTTSGVPTAVVAETTTWEAFPQLWGELLADVWAFVRTTELAPGRNVMLYLDDLPTVEVGVEVAASFAASDRVVSSSLPAGRAAMAVARGAPSAATLGAAHAAVREWCVAEGLEPTGVRWEVYGHWLEQQDPARYEIEVYWLLR